MSGLVVIHGKLEKVGLRVQGSEIYGPNSILQIDKNSYIAGNAEMIAYTFRRGTQYLMQKYQKWIMHEQKMKTYTYTKEMSCKRPFSTRLTWINLL